MKIGVDLDDVVFEFTKEILKLVREVHDKSFEFEEVNNYSFHELFELDPLEISEVVKSVDMANLNLIPGAKDFVLKLSKKHEIYFITSRVFREGTKESLEKNFSGLAYGLFFSSNPYIGTEGKDKGEICKELGVDFMIEDSTKHAKICADKGIKTFLIDKPWNQKLEKHPNIFNVKGFEEILKLIENLEEIKNVS